MPWLITILFIIFPVVSGLVLFVAYFLDDKKNSFIYPILIGLFFGVIVYHYLPPSDYDLFRHHQVVLQMMGVSWKNIWIIADKMEIESLATLISYVVALIGDKNLLQFFIVSVGYSILFYLLYDYRKQTNLPLIVFIPITIFTFFGFSALFFISGLWNYVAILIFALGFYLDYYKNKNKILCYIIYLIPVLLHSAMVFPLGILILYKLFGNKLNIKTIITMLIILIFSMTILHYINQVVSIELFITIERMYNSYFINNTQMYTFYGGTAFLIEMSKLAITIIAIFLQNEKEKFSKINGFIILLSIAVLIMLPKTIVVIRFIMLIQFIGIIPIMDAFKKMNKNKLLLLFSISALSIIFIVYQMKLFQNQSFGTLFTEGILKNFFSIFRR